MLHRAILIFTCAAGLALAAAARADFSLGFQAFADGDYAVALDELAAAADDGDYGAAILVATIHANGLGRPADLALSLRWLERAAEGGPGPAALISGAFLGLRSNATTALAPVAAHAVAQADAGDAAAQFVLGWMLGAGLGMAADPEAAAR
ncbi:MAG: SEL1-like repeat protein, partial [Proteobacteria bacterium]|nr:SEL1-like repeat protein [Pseudomonadota bacterium]